MKTVYVCSASSIPLWRQFRNVNEHIWGDFKFVFNENEEYDYLVVMDCLNKPLVTNCPKENRFVFLGEPPLVKRYNRNYLSQFGNVITCQKRFNDLPNVHIGSVVLPWMVGCSFNSDLSTKKGFFLSYSDFLTANDPENRLDKACLITSNKTLTYGHRQRVKFANKLLENKVSCVDIYGNGYEHINDKFEVLKRYKYSVVIENGSYPNYWTEKLADCMLSGCFPIYFGDPTILEKFPNGGIVNIDITNYSEALNKIQMSINNNLYGLRQQEMLVNKRLILDEYNLFNQIAYYIEKYSSNSLKLEKKEILKPFEYTIVDKIKQFFAFECGIELK